MNPSTCYRWEREIFGRLKKPDTEDTELMVDGDDSPLAEAILDRIKHDAYKINIISAAPANYRSMREGYGLEKSLIE